MLFVEEWVAWTKDPSHLRYIKQATWLPTVVICCWRDCATVTDATFSGLSQFSKQVKSLHWLVYHHYWPL